jgi:hypothetical protein
VISIARKINRREHGGKLLLPSLFALWFLYLIATARKLTTEGAEKTQRKQRKIIVSFSVFSVVFVFDFNRQEN